MFPRPDIRAKVESLACQNVLIGTSSWKYPGWCGQIYDEQRYLTRSKFSEKKFNETCLSEYAETFKTVCVDAGYYKFPDERYLEKLSGQVPDDFRFSFKATDVITIKQFPNHSKFGSHAGQVNRNFLNADLFQSAFLKPCEPFKSKIGLLMFEFSQFHKHEFEHGREFVAALKTFLSKLPREWQYGVEIRNKTFLHDEYFAVLREFGVALVFNSWSRMPPVNEQMAMNGSDTTDFVAARFLLTPGQTYDGAVKSFSPYTETKAVDLGARKAGRDLIQKAAATSKRPSFIYVNNRLEGNAMNTIAAMTTP